MTEEDYYDSYNPDFEEEEEDDGYLLHILQATEAESHIKDTKRVNIGTIRPVPVETTVDGQIADDDFWNKLDTLDSVLRTRKKLLRIDGDTYTCVKCKQSFSTWAETLRHFWESHKQVVDSIMF